MNNISGDKIDGFKTEEFRTAFDWGKTSDDYAKYRDIYPAEFYERLNSFGIGTAGQRVLDLGTGTGVLPRNMLRFGGKWTGSDISGGQIEQAKKLADGTDIEFICAAAEDIDLPDGSFDAVTACQCFWYFDAKTLVPTLDRLLVSGGKLAVMEMAWLPFDDELAGECEKLILKYNPNWTGCSYTRREVHIPSEVLERFDIVKREGFDVNVPFTRQSWHGRLKACRGTAVSMTPEQLAEWERDDMALLESKAPEQFSILHHAAFCILEKKQ